MCDEGDHHTRRLLSLVEDTAPHCFRWNGHELLEIHLSQTRKIFLAACREYRCGLLHFVRSDNRTRDYRFRNIYVRIIICRYCGSSRISSASQVSQTSAGLFREDRFGSLFLSRSISNFDRAGNYPLLLKRSIDSAIIVFVGE